MSKFNLDRMSKALHKLPNQLHNIKEAIAYTVNPNRTLACSLLHVGSPSPHVWLLSEESEVIPTVAAQSTRYGPGFDTDAVP